ncbi:phage major capsid protein [Pseudomonadota bacterium]
MMKNSAQLQIEVTNALTALEKITTKAQSEKRSLNGDQEFQDAKDNYDVIKSQLKAQQEIEAEQRSMAAGFKDVSAANDGEKRALGQFVKTGETRSLGAGSANGNAELARATTYANDILLVVKDNSVMRQNAASVSVSGSSFTDTVGTGSVSTQWSAEGSDYADTSDLDLAQRKIEVGKLTSIPALTEETVDQSNVVNLESWLISETGSSQALAEEAAFWNGDGTNKPTGLMTENITATPADLINDIKLVESETADKLVPTDFTNAVYAMKTTYTSGAKWYMSRSMAAKVAKVEDTAGNLQLMTTDKGVSQSILGYPIVVTDALEGTGNIVFANMAQGYRIVDQESPIKVHRDELTQPGLVKFPTRRYVGGKMRTAEAVKVLRIKTAA